MYNSSRNFDLQKKETRHFAGLDFIYAWAQAAIFRRQSRLGRKQQHVLNMNARIFVRSLSMNTARQSTGTMA